MNDLPLSHLKATVLAVGFTLSCLASTLADESTTYAPDPIDWSGSGVRYQATTQKAPNEKGFNTMAGVGARPSKAELAKMEQAGQTAPARRMFSDTDRQFLQMAVKDGVKDVHLAEMAVQRARNEEVKKVGNRIVADRKKVTNQLMGIAVKNGLKPDVRSAAAIMSKKDLENFDAAWLGLMAKEQQKDIAAFNRHTKSGEDLELKAFLAQALPLMQEHLGLLQAAQKKVGSAATASATTSGMPAQVRR